MLAKSQIVGLLLKRSERKSHSAYLLQNALDSSLPLQAYKKLRSTLSFCSENRVIT